MSDRTLGMGATHADSYFWRTDDEPPHDSDTCIARDCGECSALRAGDEDVYCRAIVEVWQASASGPKEAVTCDQLTDGGPICARHLEMQKREMEER